MSEFLIREVKCESIGGFTVVSSSFMDDENDLLAWTNELTYPTSSFTTIDPATENNSDASRDSLPSAGRKRVLWESDVIETKKLMRRLEDVDGDLTKVIVLPEKQSSSPEDSGDASLPLWQNDAMETGPTVFDGSLSGLGTNFILNDAIAAQSLTVFKQEGTTEHNELQNDTDSDGDCNLQKLLQSNGPRSNLDCRFQYVLAAATSITTKQGEETLTYLNQGQSYGIKLKKVGELLGFKGKLLKSIVRLQFHERRLQYSEKEQILAWQASRPGERIVELDVPLSYGLFDVEHDSTMVNTLSFCWDPTQEVGAYIKVNSISTEFTPKKHGGEKGVPFRIQVETFIQNDTYRLHAAACQIRVFKLKGADRKHKQEREKWNKLSENERSKYQPPFESTILTDLSPDAVVPPQPFVNPTDTNNFSSYTAPRQVSAGGGARGSRANGVLPALPDPNEMVAKLEEAAVPSVPQVPVTAPVVAALPNPDASQVQVQFSVEMSREQVSSWMVQCGFEMLASTFSHFSGTDMLRLTRQDLINMCGLPNGTRLYYALRSKPAIRLMMFINLPGKPYYQAIYMNVASAAELTMKLAALLKMNQASVADLYLAGPNGIHVLITDELLGNINNEASFSLHLLKDEASDRCCLILRPTTA